MIPGHDPDGKIPMTLSFQVKKADENIVTGLTHRHRVLTRKVDGSEFKGPWYKQLLYPVVDVVLEWSLHSWLWYLCGTNAVLLFNKDVSRWVVALVELETIIDLNPIKMF